MINIFTHPLYGKHDLDSAMMSLWNFYKKNFLTLFIISLIISLISQLSTLMVNFEEIKNMTSPNEIIDYLRQKIVPLTIIMLLSLLFNVILNHYILIKPVDSSAGTAGIILKSFKYFLPYLIIIIIFSFAGSFILVLGLLALVIGVFFAILYLLMISFFILPVMMSEGDNIGNVITRTIKLSHKNLWPNLGWSAVIILIYLVLSFVLSGLVMLPFTGTFFKALINPENTSSLISVATNPVVIFLSAVSSALLMPLFPIFSFILYFNARAREEEIFTGSNESSNNQIKVEDLYALPKKEEGEPEQN